MDGSRACILFNPSAGRGKAGRRLRALRKCLDELGLAPDIFVTKSEEDLKERARESSSRYPIVVGAGGDSTFNIIVNEIIRAGSPTVFGMIGLGSSNDIVREFGLETLKTSCLALKRGRTKSIDIGVIKEGDVNRRYFLGQANVGLGAEVNVYVENLFSRSPRGARIQFLAGISGIREAFRTGKVPAPFNITAHHHEVSGLFVSALFSNIRYWSTGRKVCPDARPDDGLMDSCLIRECSMGRLAKIAFLAGRGKHTGLKEIDIFQSGLYDISSEQAFMVQTDGEILGGHGQPDRFHSVAIHNIPGALRIIY